MASAEHRKVTILKLPIGRRARGILEPASTATTTANRTNVKIRKLCSPDMLSDSRTAPWFCVRIRLLTKGASTAKGNTSLCQHNSASCKTRNGNLDPAKMSVRGIEHWSAGPWSARGICMLYGGIMVRVQVLSSKRFNFVLEYLYI